VDGFSKSTGQVSAVISSKRNVIKKWTYAISCFYDNEILLTDKKEKQTAAKIQFALLDLEERSIK
jgi:hypothetical protein